MSSFAPSEMFVPLQQQPSNFQPPMGYSYDMVHQQAHHYQQQPTNLQMSSSYDMASHQAHLQEQPSNHQLQMGYSYDMTGQLVHHQQQHPPNLQLPMAFPYDMTSQHALLQQQQHEPLSPSVSCESPDGTSSSVVSHRVFVGSLQIEVDEEIVKRVFEKKEPNYAIRDVKVLRESNGQSKGFGFVTYANIEHAQEILKKEPGTFTYKGRAWNIAPAIRRYTPRASPLPQNVGYYPFSPTLGPYSPAIPFSPAMFQYPNGTSYFF